MKKFILPLSLILFLLFSITAFGDVAFVAIAEFKTDGGESIAMEAPAAASIGDLLIAYISKDDPNVIDNIGETWTVVFNNGATGANTLYVAWRIADSGDAGETPTEYTWTETSGNEDWVGEILCYSGVNTESPIHGTPGISTGDSTTPTAPSVAFTNLTAGSLVLQCMGIDSDDNDYVTPAQLTQRFNAIQANDIGGAGGDKVSAWVSPTGHVAGDWQAEANAYDEDTGVATNFLNIPENSWSDYLELTISSITCSKVRFYAYYNAATINSIILEVYYSAGWHEIYEGVFADKEWVEKAIGSTQDVTSMRMKFYNDGAATHSYVYEVDFWEILEGSGNTGTAVFTATSRDWAAATVIIEAEAAEEEEANVIFFGMNF